MHKKVLSKKNKNFEQAIVKELINRNIKISFAESCTGGLVASKLTNIPGVSKIFDMSVVTYSNQSKISILGVNKETLDKYGAVSKETATEMALGIKTLSKADIGISITGIAGPGGGTKEKPVGLVYIALAANDKLEYKELTLSGDRNSIRNTASLYVFNLIESYLKNI